MAAIKLLLDGPIVPKLFVFDLDYTLWPFWCDTHVDPPFSKDKQGRVIDKNGYVVELYDDVLEIFKILVAQNLPIAAASRTSSPSTAQKLLNILDIDKYFEYKELYPGTKLKHFQQFRNNSGISYEDMVFYDDEYRNIKEIGDIGVTCQQVNNGVTFTAFQNGLEKFVRRRRNSCDQKKQTKIDSFFQTKS